MTIRTLPPCVPRVPRLRPNPGLLAGVALSAALPAPAAPPSVTNVTAAQRAGTKLVDITYDVADADEDTLAMSVEISGDGGSTYVVPAASLTEGATANSYPQVIFPAGVTSLPGRTIVWDAGTDFNEQFNDQMKVRVIAEDGPTPPTGTTIV
ncbi:MAG: hypothetical protein HKN82_14900, partial [Akkermansiaceae bacterium]|nr:hypothetical protein [Akkermansiaceae bacterium]